ncbi:putative ABC transport system permease protein [Streptoalloteichus tenebrarius]|uniref:ABC transport system permease protein n=1 Tax=Streptoalloteichus tenebrarius (strain ATCC 17920 / DSM 40477 / JCM 4838 / CBS 697.72 / NBRC 16177 / NCIMB 11028 / NRRL B-12390 / A12253. 1 / ISP 5477) TaxID=1933 RepID=A0ABT1I2P3_STRSD|nr:ABC transporter permease [Streptoalloteichus tenebrarius]MCP2262064.1 putative ABC transport system permease protein [Streptoalloteichus tenebrarius]
MLRATLAGIRARMMRLLLSSVAIVLGVAFVSGTLVLGDAMDAETKDNFARDTRNVDVVVNIDGDVPEGQPRMFTPEQVDAVRRVSGVASAEGREFVLVPMVHGNGRAKPAAGVPMVRDTKLLPVDLKDGRFPQRDDEVTLDERTAKNDKISVGQQVEFVDKAEQRRKFTVVGVYQRGVQASSLYLADQFIATSASLRSLNPEGAKGAYEIVVAGAAGVSQADLAKRVQDSFGKPYVKATTGEEATRKALESYSKQASSLTTFMLTFAVIALVVAAMVIYNTFTILIAQRTRELALLRCVGADRGQLFGSVLLEAVVMGLVASVVGLAGGVGTAAALQLGVNAMTDSDSAVRVPVTATTVLAALGVGVVVTVLSAVLPARRATRVAPIAALRSQPDSQEEVARTGKLRIAAIALLTLLGGGLIAMGMKAEGDAAMMIVGGGTMVLLLAVVALGPMIVGPINRVLGVLPGALFGVPAKLASANAGRNPKRTAATTAALMIGVTIVSLVTVVATSTKQAGNEAIDKQFPVDYTVTSAMYDRQLPTSLVDALRRVDGVEKVSPGASVQVKLGETYASVDGVTRDAIGSLVRPTTNEGDLGKLGGDTVALLEKTAKAQNLKVGDTVTVSVLDREGGETRKQQLKVVAIYHGRELPEAMVDLGTATRMNPARAGYDQIMVDMRDGVDPVAGKEALEKALASVPTAEVSSAADVKADLNKNIDTALAVVWALLGLAVVIALFGIANTLSLSVLERTRESALLRALGLTKGQLRLMLLVESVLMALMGAILGVALGVGFAWALTSSLSGADITLNLVVPYGQIGVMLLVALVAAMAAAVLPARRAARTSVVSAMAAD